MPPPVLQLIKGIGTCVLVIPCFSTRRMPSDKGVSRQIDYRLTTINGIAPLYFKLANEARRVFVRAKFAIAPHMMAWIKHLPEAILFTKFTRHEIEESSIHVVHDPVALDIVHTNRT